MLIHPRSHGAEAGCAPAHTPLTARASTARAPPPPQPPPTSRCEHVLGVWVAHVCSGIGARVSAQARAFGSADSFFKNLLPGACAYA